MVYVNDGERIENVISVRKLNERRWGDNGNGKYLKTYYVLIVNDDIRKEYDDEEDRNYVFKYISDKIDAIEL